MKLNSGGSSTKFILLHPYIQNKQGSSGRLWLLAVVSFFTIAFLLSLVYNHAPASSSSSSSAATVFSLSAVAPATPGPLPTTVINTLLHYVSRSNDSYHMSGPDLKLVSDIIRKCPAPCNFLVFGLTHETLLWKALNHNGRTIFIDENRYYAAYVEEKHPEIDAYDVQYTTKMGEMAELIAAAKEQTRNECRPVQNLLFSECRLGINDLPNLVYDVDWDVILVDGPRGDKPESPGRMSAIFTAAVLARSKKAAGGNPRTHVLLHDYYRNVEKVCGDEFLCRDNLVESTGMLAHFVLERMDPNSFDFCPNKAKPSSSSPSSSSASSSSSSGSRL
ncbi:hypothetical protein SAY87_009116 [Trapa incisa]|uniref:Polysaccharide biosynthesis domain-containing protein n=1 Tax=Trapa incisa TaxID=236973 RepID=A0AAN7PX65_9MYRT|nr:hypothetical protein SAY87_009116 [Trapa incisa]